MSNHGLKHKLILNETTRHLWSALNYSMRKNKLSKMIKLGKRRMRLLHCCFYHYACLKKGTEQERSRRVTGPMETSKLSQNGRQTVHPLGSPGSVQTALQSRGTPTVLYSSCGGCSWRPELSWAEATSPETRTWKSSFIQNSSVHQKKTKRRRGEPGVTRTSSWASVFTLSFSPVVTEPSFSMGE